VGTSSIAHAIKVGLPDAGRLFFHPFCQPNIQSKDVMIVGKMTHHE